MIRVVLDTNIIVSALLQPFEPSAQTFFLECAFAARAPYLVTGNLSTIRPSWADIKVVTPCRMLEVVTSRTGPAGNTGQ